MRRITVLCLLVTSLDVSGAYAAENIPRAIPVPITINGIISLSKAGVGVSDEVIISQIKATHSIFVLTSEEIIKLKQSGVSNNVINFMIQTGVNIPKAIEITPPPRIRYYYYYGPACRYYYRWEYDPWYTPWCDTWGNLWYAPWTSCRRF